MDAERIEKLKEAVEPVPLPEEENDKGKERVVSFDLPTAVGKKVEPQTVDPFFAELGEKLMNYNMFVNNVVFPRFLELGHEEAIVEHQNEFGMKIRLALQNPVSVASLAATVGLTLNADMKDRPPRYLYGVIMKMKEAIVAGMPMSEVRKIAPDSDKVFTGQDAYFSEPCRDLTLRSLRYLQYFAENMWNYQQRFAQ